MKQLILQFENANVMNRLIKVIELMKGVSIVDVTSTPKKSGLDAALEDVKGGEGCTRRKARMTFLNKSWDNVFHRIYKTIQTLLETVQEAGIAVGGTSQGHFLVGSSRAVTDGI